MTFDVLADIYVGKRYGWASLHEVSVKCRRCDLMSVAKIVLNNAKSTGSFERNSAFLGIEADLAPTFAVEGFLDVSDLRGVVEPPADVPEAIAQAFSEGARCMAIHCYNAAAAMFRLCLDLTTKPLLPDPNDMTVAQPSKRERFNLGPRVDWLIEIGALPTALAELAHCVRQDGNDGAHDGSLTQDDAADLIDFTIALLERQFTEPARLKAAKARQAARQAAASK